MAKLLKYNQNVIQEVLKETEDEQQRKAVKREKERYRIALINVIHLSRRTLESNSEIYMRIGVGTIIWKVIQWININIIL